MAEKINLSVIILNYNTHVFLQACLRSLAKSQKEKITLETIVVDNASTDGSGEMVKENFPEVKLIMNKKNIGFAAANNQAVKKAKGQYLLFLNPDTLVQPETLKTMVKYMKKNPKTGAATCRVELTNGQLDYACHRGFPTPWNAFTYFSGLAKLFPKSKLFSGYTLSHLSLQKTHPIDSACGAFLMVRREAGEESHWWDEDYFWYGEDLDFCYRLKEKGWRIDYVPQTKIIHYKGAASGIKKHSQKLATATKETKKRAIKASTEVMRVFFQKHYQNKYPQPIYWLVMSGINLLEKYRMWRHLR
ncbi:MAG: glycosyltransferase family 2 protein [Candidatus Marinimicrobia bacterium]|nr:glycosyltransferase family 2 protein [Candidatus Neomarinimicrobiota bacterium]